MDNFENTVGFFTGGAAGIGLGVARELGRKGMTLILADIEPATLDTAASALRDEGLTVETEVLDVADHDTYKAVAAGVLERHGSIQFLFNNAGVAGPSPISGGSLEDWRWVVDVNLMGVVYGVELFLPAMQASGQPSYIINTASMAGHLGNANMASYCATKFAVVGYSEVMRTELSETNVGVSVLCPAWVKTRIAESLRNHPNPDLVERSDEQLSTISQVIADEGISVEQVARRVVAGMADETFYLFTHPEFWPYLEERLNRIRNDYGSIGQ